jgi:hypothetical protein
MKLDYRYGIYQVNGALIETAQAPGVSDEET